MKNVNTFRKIDSLVKLLKNYLQYLPQNSSDKWNEKLFEVNNSFFQHKKFQKRRQEARKIMFKPLVYFFYQFPKVRFLDSINVLALLLHVFRVREIACTLFNTLNKIHSLILSVSVKIKKISFLLVFSRVSNSTLSTTGPGVRNMYDQCRNKCLALPWCQLARQNLNAISLHFFGYSCY